MLSLAIWNTCSPLTLATLDSSGTAGDQRLHADRGGRVADRGAAGGAGAGDGAAGGEDHHVGQRLLRLRERAGRQQCGAGREGPETGRKVHGELLC
jgi:hypothetical protein